MHGLLLQYVAGEEKEGCEDEDWGGVSEAGWGKGKRKGEEGGEGRGSLPTPEDMATEIWPLVRSMVGVNTVGLIMI